MILPIDFDPLLAQYIAGGFLGSLAKSLLESDGTLVMPHLLRDANGGIDSIKMGFVGNVLIGIITAIAVDHSFLIALLSAFCGGYILELSAIRFKKIIRSALGDD